MRSTLLAAVALLSLAGAANAQQVADPNADLSVARPAYAAGTGPVSYTHLTLPTKRIV